MTKQQYMQAMKNLEDALNEQSPAIRWRVLGDLLYEPDFPIGLQHINIIGSLDILVRDISIPLSIGLAKVVELRESAPQYIANMYAIELARHLVKWQPERGRE